jgi:hypothetical protein
MVAANPFGRNAFTGGESSRVEVEAGKPFVLHYAMLVFQLPVDRDLDAAGIYRAYSKQGMPPH